MKTSSPVTPTASGVPRRSTEDLTRSSQVIDTASCNVCGHLHKLVEVPFRGKTVRLCDGCATKLVSDIQRALIPSMG